MILIGGGPCYVQKLSPNVLPFTQNLSDIVPRIGILGGGRYENLDDRLLIRNYKFSEQTIRFLHRVQCDTRYLGCRDPYSVKVLANNGLRGYMTGCPAWYDIKMLDKRIEGTLEIKKIAVSDPADVLSYGKQSIRIIKYLKEKFPDAQIAYFFHRGIEKTVLRKKWLEM